MTNPSFVPNPPPGGRIEHKRWVDGDYIVTTDPDAVDLDVVHEFLRGSYWADRRSREEQARGNANSRTYTLLHTPTREQHGFARAVTDHLSFAWLADVFVIEAARGRGLGRYIVQCVVDDLQHVQRLVLGTRDAHGLYAQFGFATLARPERWMERVVVSPPQ